MSTFVTISQLETVENINSLCRILMDDGLDNSDTKNITVDTLRSYIQSGITPHIDANTGNWFIGQDDTGVKASQDSINFQSLKETPSVLPVENTDGTVSFDIKISNREGNILQLVEALEGTETDSAIGLYVTTPDLAVATDEEIEEMVSLIFGKVV